MHAFSIDEMECDECDEWFRANTCGKFPTVEASMRIRIIIPSSNDVLRSFKQLSMNHLFVCL